MRQVALETCYGVKFDEVIDSFSFSAYVCASIFHQ